jgi:hypothetical protein
MTKWYSPQLSRELVGKLYHRAAIERAPMTRLANRLMEKALDREQAVECQQGTASDIALLSERAAGPVKSPAIAPR